MSPRELVRKALAGQAIPRPAVGPLAVHYCAKLAGISLRQYTLDPESLAQSVIAYYRRFRPDAVWLSADTWVNAQAMGAAVGFPDDQPAGGIGKPRIRCPEDLDAIPPPDVTRHGRWPLMLEAFRLIRKGLGDEVFLVACFDQYPFSLASQLLGVNQMMFAILEDRPFVERLMEKCLAYTLAYATALGEAGADMLSGGDSPAALIGPRLYAEVAQPFEKRLIERLKERVRVPVSLHICGNATPLLRDMAATGADVLEIDHYVRIEDAAQSVGSTVALWGNLDPVGLLAQADSGTVYQETQALLNRVRECKIRRFVLSSGCTLAVETPEENLEAFFAAAQDMASTWET